MSSGTCRDAYPVIEIDHKSIGVGEMVFVGNGDLISCGINGAFLWRVNDATTNLLSTQYVQSLAVSKDDKWIAGGTFDGQVIVWDATRTTHQFVASFRVCEYTIYAVDFSPDGTRIVIASGNDTAAVFDVATRRLVLGPFKHESSVRAAKYSPQGDWFATATSGNAIRVYHNDGNLLTMVRDGSKTIFWSNDRLFFHSGSEIKRVDIFGRLAVVEWPLPGQPDGIAISHQAMFVASYKDTSVSFWDTSTHTQLGCIQHPERIRAIVFSPDDCFLAIRGQKKITVHNISPIAQDSIHFYHTLRELEIRVNKVAQDAWKHGQLEAADASLSTVLLNAPHSSYHVLASRALIRTRMQRWHSALRDAERSIEVQPSVIGHIAKSMALFGQGEKEEACQTYDIGLQYLPTSNLSDIYFRLIKAVLIFIAGDHMAAISCIHNMIATPSSNSLCYVVQAYMHLLRGNSQLESGDHEGALHSFNSALTQLQMYDPSAMNSILVLISLISGWEFDRIDGLQIMIRQGLSKALYAAHRTNEAVESFLMVDTLAKEGSVSESVMEWVAEFRQRCCKELEPFGDAAMVARQYNDAIGHYSAALCMNSDSPDLFIKRSKARIANELWSDALNDADEAIARDPSSPWGYEVKHSVLLGIRRYTDAADAFNTMATKIAESPYPEIRNHLDEYTGPSTTRGKIQKIVERTLERLPRVLINTSTGRLCSRTDLATAFESSAVFHELLSSSTQHVNRNRVKREVKDFFRYVMLSHRWEDNEPLYQEVVNLVVYDLPESLTHVKLQTFCKLARDDGFNWAWSDTCCIDKQDRDTLHEALVAMFEWYRNSALVIIYLLGVRYPAKAGDLVKSIWNTRAWTFQEYVAARVVRFYTEDWDLYLDLTMRNHKDSPEIILEMEKVTGVRAALRPGLSNIREKLCRASTRKTTRVEDAAYSLLGIFSATGLLPNYGEAEKALGRLLAYIFSGSGDVSILAWTGQASQVNSCLPASISVYSKPTTSHFPHLIKGVEMETSVSALRNSISSLDLAIQLYRHLSNLPIPSFTAHRMILPCIAFKLEPFVSRQTRSGLICRSETAVFGVMEIKTKRDLSRIQNLYFVHPWLDALLGREEADDMHTGGSVDDMGMPDSDDEDIDGEDNHGDDVDYFDAQEVSSPVSESDVPGLCTPVTQLDDETSALQLAARLRQPFGPLLLMRTPMRGRQVYKRILADTLITAQIRAEVSLDQILDNVCVLDVL